MTPIDIILKYNLKPYFKAIYNSKSANLPYHNIEHLLGVMTDVLEACHFYFFSFTETRTLLIAALFHDYNHTGVMGDDVINIKIAIDGITEHILESDKIWLPDIISYISATQFPHSSIEDTEENLPQNIIRDADVAYTLKDEWFNLVTNGLGAEMGKTPEEMLKMQVPFMENYLVLTTDWAKEKYAKTIKARIAEVTQIIKVLY